MSQYREPYVPFFEQSFNEAIVQPEEYFKSIEKDCKNFFRFNKNKNNIKKICDNLSVMLRKHKIKFIPNIKVSTKRDPYIPFGINSANVMFDKYITIVIHCNENIIKSFNDEEYFTRFIAHLYVAIKHELIHRQQFLRIQSEELSSKIGNTKKFDNDLEYMSDKQEIMSFAWQAIEYFKLAGVKKQNILSILREPKEYFRFDNSVFSAYWWAYERKLISKETIQLFYKYAYLYATED